MHKVSIIIVNYNGMPYINACLTSLYKQDYGNYEIIFVDNASADDSLKFVRDKFPQLKIVANNKNLGYAGGINSALPIATGYYIAPINVDTEAMSDWLAELVSFMDTRPEAGAVTTKILLHHKPDIINTMGLNIHISGLGSCRKLNQKDDGSASPEKVSGISGCSYLIKKETLGKIGGAPEYCFMGNDDVIISWLLNLMGYELYCIPTAIIHHHYHTIIGVEKLYNLEKNRLFLLFSTLNPSTLILLSPILIAIELMVISFCLLKGWSYLRAKMKSYSDLYKERKFIMQKRQQYKSLRQISDLALLKRLRWNLDWKQLWMRVS